MILSYRDKRTRQFADGQRIRAFAGFDLQGWERLEILTAAASTADLAALPSNRFEALRCERAGQFSIRINEQWRICFDWPDGELGPSNVEITDEELE